MTASEWADRAVTEMSGDFVELFSYGRVCTNPANDKHLAKEVVTRIVAAAVGKATKQERQRCIAALKALREHYPARGEPGKSMFTNDWNHFHHCALTEALGLLEETQK